LVQEHFVHTMAGHRSTPSMSVAAPTPKMPSRQLLLRGEAGGSLLVRSMPTKPSCHSRWQPRDHKRSIESRAAVTSAFCVWAAARRGIRAVRSHRCRSKRNSSLVEATGTSVSVDAEPQLPSLQEADLVSVGDMRVPHVGLGTISWSAETDADELRLRDLAMEAVASNTLLDTAERYGTELGPPFDRWPFGTPGRCEEILGGSLQHMRGAVATKFTPTPWNSSREGIVNACTKSARRLGVETIDLYQIHHPDIVQPLRKFGLGKPKDEELWEGLADCVEHGLVRNVGVCNYGPTLLRQAQDALGRRGVRLVSNQINFSLLYQRQGVMETLAACAEMEIEVMAYWPLAMGLLTGASELSAPGKRGKDLHKYMQGGGAIPVPGIQPLMSVVRDIAESRGKTCSQVSLNWIVCKGAIPIPGARTISRYREYMGALGWRLTNQEVARLDEASQALPFDFEGAGYRFSNAKFVGYGVERWYLN